MKASEVRSVCSPTIDRKTWAFTGFGVDVGDDDRLARAKTRPDQAEPCHGVADLAGNVPGEGVGVADAPEDQLVTLEHQDGRARVTHECLQVVEQKLQQPGQLERRRQVARCIEQSRDLWAELAQAVHGSGVIELLGSWAHGRR
jgi:hypothetical protein